MSPPPALSSPPPQLSLLSLPHAQTSPPAAPSHLSPIPSLTSGRVPRGRAGGGPLERGPLLVARHCTNTNTYTARSLLLAHSPPASFPLALPCRQASGYAPRLQPIAGVSVCPVDDVCLCVSWYLSLSLFLSVCLSVFFSLPVSLPLSPPSLSPLAGGIIIQQHGGRMGQGSRGGRE